MGPADAGDQTAVYAEDLSIEVTTRQTKADLVAEHLQVLPSALRVQRTVELASSSSLSVSDRCLHPAVQCLENHVAVQGAETRESVSQTVENKQQG